MPSIDAIPARLRRSLDGFAAVAANRGLRRVVAAYGGFNVGEWATWIAILVFAYERGGAAETGLVAFVQLVPATLVAPVAAGLGDRFARERVLLFSYLAQATAMTATATALLLDAPAPLVYLLAAVTTSTVTLTRPAHGAILPSLAMTPGQLTAANAASGTVQNVSMLGAPLVAGVLYEVAGAGAVFVLAAAGCFVSAWLVSRVRTTDDDVEPGPAESVGASLAGGISTLRRLPGPRTIVLLLAAASVIEGALDVLIVVLAIDLLAIGESGVGLLSSAVGAGGLIGAAAGFVLVGRRRLGVPFGLGLVVWGIPMVAVGLVPLLAVAIALFVVAGAGRSLADLAGRTLLQRVTPDRSLGRVFGVLEGVHTGMLGVGSVAVPAFIGLTGPREALLLLGLWMPIVVVVGWRALRAVDDAAVVHVRELEVLRATPVFAPLPPPALERLSAHLVRRGFESGDWIIRQGERGDRYYVIDAGEVDVIIDGTLVRTQGPGDGFGEIALLRDVPRTASIRARTAASVWELDRDVFLAVVGRHPLSSRLAADVVSERLASA
jgi:Cyclic nucleotide-binding domain/Major Facilitator Superfamily